MFNNQKEIIVNTSHIGKIEVAQTTLENKLNIYNNLYDSDLLTMAVLINEDNINKIQLCIESIANTTEDFNYNLLIIINLPVSKEVEDFIDSIEVENKKIIKTTSGNGMSFSYYLALSNIQTRYTAIVNADIVLNYNWLNNMLSCAKSDEKIGIVSCLTAVDFLSKHQDVVFESIDDMQEKSKILTKSDPTLWQESLYIKNPDVFLIKKEVIDEVGFLDLSFTNAFNDYSKRMTNIGYMNFICNDCFFLNLSDKLEKSDNDLDFKNRYNIDSFDEYIYNDKVLLNLLNLNTKKQNQKDIPKILTIDVGYGASIIEIKNHLRSNSINKFEINSFTTSPKYFNNLNILTKGNAKFGAIEEMKYEPNSYDYIIVGQSINYYYNMEDLLSMITNYAKKGARILIKLENCLNNNQLLSCLSLKKLEVELNKKEYAYFVTFKDFMKNLENYNLSSCDIDYNFLENVDDTLSNLIKEIKNKDEFIDTTTIKEYCFCLIK